MSTRREFLIKTAASVGAAASLKISRAAQDTATVAHTGSGVSRIKSAIRRDETILRLGGSCDGFHMSWAANDRQFVAIQDGTGWFKNPKGQYNSRLWTVSGSPQNATFHDVPGYPEIFNWGNDNEPLYYGFGTLVLDGRIYQYLSTLNHMNDRPVRWVGAKLIFSPDSGRTWHNQDESTPVVWEPWEKQSRKTLVFFKESQEAFSLLSILQMGRNYKANRDGYVYVYGTNGNTDGSMNQLVMFRVPKASMLNRSAYEYFSGVKSDGSATWTRNIGERGVVHTLPSGWVNKADRPDEIVVESWLPSVTYNEPIGLYMMANTGIGCGSDGAWFGKPSYLGLWVASKPWGPWTQIHEETAWMPGNDANARAYDLQIAPKWIAPDGKSFWLVWADFQGFGELREQAKKLQEETKEKEMTHDQKMQMVALQRKAMPYYSFNTQRFDLVLA